MKRLLGTTVAIVALMTGAFAMAADCDGVLPEEAYQMVKDNPNAYIIDVRSPAEYYWVGHPETNLADDPDSGFLEGRVVHIPYKFWIFDPATGDYYMPINKFFARDVAAAFPEGATLIFMCRSGQRSCDCQHWLLDPKNSRLKDLEKIKTFTMYNLDEGFEGGRDPETGHRTLDAGWKNLGLPYNDKDDGIWTGTQGARRPRRR
jgi:rhodanese-related sulfurtransferase